MVGTDEARRSIPMPQMILPDLSLISKNPRRSTITQPSATTPQPTTTPPPPPTPPSTPPTTTPSNSSSTTTSIVTPSPALAIPCPTSQTTTPTVTLSISAASSAASVVTHTSSYNRTASSSIVEIGTNTISSAVNENTSSAQPTSKITSALSKKQPKPQKQKSKARAQLPTQLATSKKRKYVTKKATKTTNAIKTKAIEAPKKKVISFVNPLTNSISLAVAPMPTIPKRKPPQKHRNQNTSSKSTRVCDCSTSSEDVFGIKTAQVSEKTSSVSPALDAWQGVLGKLDRQNASGLLAREVAAQCSTIGDSLNGTPGFDLKLIYKVVAAAFSHEHAHHHRDHHVLDLSSMDSNTSNVLSALMMALKESQHGAHFDNQRQQVLDRTKSLLTATTSTLLSTNNGINPLQITTCTPPTTTPPTTTPPPAIMPLPPNYSNNNNNNNNYYDDDDDNNNDNNNSDSTPNTNTNNNNNSTTQQQHSITIRQHLR